MKAKMIVLLSLVLTVGVTAPSLAQQMMGGSGQGMMGPRMMQGEQGNQRGQSAMDSHDMMQGRMAGMMCPMMGSMMQGDMMGASTGMGALFGSRVVPRMNLSADDVRSYLSAKLDHLGNKRLKLGNIDAEGGTITADIVTADNSLVQRVKVDRSTGDIKYEN